MKALKAFIKKAFEAPQRSENKNLKLIFLLIQLSEMHRAERIKNEEESGVCIALKMPLHRFPCNVHLYFNAINRYKIVKSIEVNWSIVTKWYDGSKIHFESFKYPFKIIPL